MTLVQIEHAASTQGTVALMPNAPTDTFSTFLLQRLHEALFDYSADSFKAPALNSHLRVVELSRIGGQAEDQEFISASVESFFSEVSWSIQNDPVIRGGQKQLMQELLTRVKNGWAKKTQFLPAMSALQLQFRRYREDLSEALRLEAKKDKWSKIKVIQLVDSLIVELELIGYPRPFIYSVVQKLSTLKKQAQLRNGALNTVDRFLEPFTLAEKEFSVIGYVSPALATAVIRLKGWTVHENGIPTENRVPAIQRLIKNVDQSLTPTIVEYRGESLCQHRAAKNYFNILDRFGEQIHFLNHHLPVHVHSNALCIDSTSKSPSILPRSSSPLRFTSRTTEKELTLGLELLKFFFNESRLSNPAKKRLSQAMEYHGAALASKRHEEQLLNLWSCLEGFVGMPSTAGSKIAFVREAILSCLTLQYPQRLFSLVANRLVDLIGEEKMNTFWGVEPLHALELRERLALILLDTSLVDTRNKLAALVAQKDPMLLYRLFDLVNRFSSPKATKETLHHHREKITWQMNRIYWNRNLIVHSAESLPYLPTLVEHLHIYVDSFLGSILYAVAKVQASTIPSVLELFSVHEKIRTDELSTFVHETSLNSSSTLDWLFGRENILRECSGL